MNRGMKSGEQRESRIELVARVRLAYEQVYELMAQPKRSTRTQVAIAAARRRLTLLNRALALVALGSALQTA